MKSIISLFVVLLLLEQTLGCGPSVKCPTGPSICKCKENIAELDCTDGYYNTFASDLNEDQIRHLFIDLSRQKPNQLFNSFKLSSTVLTRLTDDIFQDVRFKSLELIDLPKLTCVGDVFSSMTNDLTQIISSRANLSFTNSSCSIFNAMSKLASVQTINITGSQISEITSGAFTNKQNRLSKINLSGGELTKINYSIVSRLQSLTYIDLSHNKINNISPGAFEMSDNYNNQLTISLESNQGLTGASFNGRTFSAKNGRITVGLNNNRDLDYLDMETFLQFLVKDSNRIDMSGTPLKVEVRNKWLLEYKDDLNLKIKVMNLRETDGKDFFSDDIQRFSPTTTTKGTDGPTPISKGTNSGSISTSSTTDIFMEGDVTDQDTTPIF